LFDKIEFEELIRIKNSYIITIFFSIIVLIVLIQVPRKRSHSTFLTKFTDILIYLLELFVAGTILNFLFDKVSFQAERSYFLIFKDYVFANSIYSILITMIIKFWDGNTIDSYNSIEVYIKRCMLLSNDEGSFRNLLNEYKRPVEHFSSNGMYTKSMIDKLEEINSYNEKFLNGVITREKYKLSMDSLLISVNNEKSIITFGWQSSLMLRLIFK